MNDARSKGGGNVTQNPVYCSARSGAHAAFRDAILAAMDRHEIDALIFPSWNNPARKIGDRKSPHGNNSPQIAPHTGQPAITVPMGFTSQGLPAGLQMLGRPCDEGGFIRLGYAYEQATGHRRPPKLFPSLNERTPVFLVGFKATLPPRAGF